MVIQIDGGGQTNKGAQLMLYAVLQEVEKQYPQTVVILNDEDSNVELLQGAFGNLRLEKLQPNWWRSFLRKYRWVPAIAFKIYKPLSWFFSLKVPHKGVDLLLNIGGFQFGDQWKHSPNTNALWRYYLSKMKSYGTKIVFMPQAFGPFQQVESKNIIAILDKYSDILMARDKVSYDYLKSLNLNTVQPVLFPDFTSTIKGILSSQASLAEGNVCIIPNNKMISQGINSEDVYLDGIVSVIKYIESKGFGVFLLNHEGEGDMILCKKIASKFTSQINILYSNSAIETKGIVAASYAVISSRYHGVANALSSGVPCLATSWSHKYQMLMDDYGLNDCLIDYSKTDEAFKRIDSILNKDYNLYLRSLLKKSLEKVLFENRRMWDMIWKEV